MPKLVMFTMVLLLAACGNKDAAGDKAKNDKPAAPRSIEITVTENGFEPDDVSVKKGQPVTLGFTRKTDKTCAKEVVLHVGDQKIEKALPLGERVEIAVTFPNSGELRYACAMDMIAGTITVQ